MPVLTNYQEFAGRHWETGSIRNALAYQGVIAPHTGKPVSEALLLGLSGGAAFGYFTFEYEGYQPHLILLTRNTFNPMDTALERLGVPQDVLQTESQKKAEANLLEVLESNRPALVWADIFSLHYNTMPYDEHNWGMMPLVVYGYEGDKAYIADRSNRPFIVPIEELNKARSRVKQEEFRVVMLDAPDWSRLARSVTDGIAQCVRLFTEMPPKGKRDNFGLAALQQWANLLTNTRNKQSWARYFEPGERMWMALAGDLAQPGAFSCIHREVGNTAERGMYADFLDEAAIILSKPDLKAVAGDFRQSEKAWSQLADMLLPDSNPVCKETKTLLTRKHTLFSEQGSEGVDGIQTINNRLVEIRAQVVADFPMSEAEVTAYREGLSAQVMTIHDLERDAMTHLKAVMG